MAVTGVDAATEAVRTSLADTYVRKDAAANNSSLSMDDFWKLLSAQLQYQDMTNPMSNSEMMGQLTQMASMNAMSTLSTTMETMSDTMTQAMESLSQISLSSYATNLLGKEVAVAELDEEGKLAGKTVGVVEGVALTGGNPYIYIDGKSYSLSQLMSMGEVPELEEDETTTTETV